MAIMPSINLSGLRGLSAATPRATASKPGASRTSASTRSSATARPSAATARPSAASATAKPGTPAGRTSAPIPTGRPGGGMARYRDPRFPDLGPEAGTPEAPRPELTPEERVARQARRTETERTSGEALGLGTKPTGPSFGRSNAQRRSGGFGIDTLAAQMAARRRGRRRPGQPME